MSVDLASIRDLYPFESRSLDRGGLSYRYVDEGRGNPVLCVHGNPTWSFYYRHLVTDLADRHRVVVPDHMGCGLSDKPGDGDYDYRLKSRIDDLDALADHLDLRENVTLVVHDWGGAIGFGWACRHPERVRRIVILNTGAFPLPPGKRFPWPLRIGRNLGVGAFLIRAFNLFAFTASHVCAVKGLTRRLRHAYRAPYASWGERIATARFVQDIPLGPGDPSWAVLAEIDAGMRRFADRPILICWGEDDFVFDRHFRDEFLRRYPEAELHSWPDAGHYVLEDKGDEVRAHVRSFLARHPLEGEGA